jgi:excisionase family DNA binding protein
MTADQDAETGERWLTVYEAAGQLLARPDTVKAWIREGLLESQDRGRLGVRIPAAALETFIRRHLATEGFRSADHSFNSGVATAAVDADPAPDAGWPFRQDDSQP